MRRGAGAAIGALATVLATHAAAAQTLTPGRPGPYAVDVRLAVVSVPRDPAFLPLIPAGTAVPSRVLGVGIGGHVYLFQLGAARLGVGADFLRSRGTASPPGVSGSTSGLPARPDTEATVTTIAPQLSFNFGTDSGWSYLSAGYGQARIETAASAFGTSGSDAPATAAPQSFDSGTRGSINVGGGARWFLRRHIAFAFDVRFHLVQAGAARGTAPATPRATVLAASAGISLR